METTLHSAQARRAAFEPQFPPLEHVTSPSVPTAQAAYYLNRRPQTLRGWACTEAGALRPVRLHGRLAWRVADIRALLGVEAAK